MKVGVYIDGFNLYYGALKGRPHKWLDLQKFSESLLRAEDGERLVTVKYCTAKSDGQAGERQQVYLRALAANCPKVQIIYGYYLKKTKFLKPVDNQRFGDDPIEVHAPEEKGSDVNLAVYMLDDIWRDRIDRAIIVSNDGDLRDAIKLARHRFKDLRTKVGIAAPLLNNRTLSRVLKDASDFRRNIEEQRCLTECQLPYRIEGTNISRPNRWLVDPNGN